LKIISILLELERTLRVSCSLDMEELKSTWKVVHRLYPATTQGTGAWPCSLVRLPPVANEPFAVILPDDVIVAETPCLQ
jgi:UTP-glucose-1-phosphate uridylyltransferase